MQTKMPRPRQRGSLLSPVGPGIVPNERMPRLHGVVAAEIRRFTYLRHAVVKRLATLICNNAIRRARLVPEDQPRGRMPQRVI